jgi:hypothetical protein
MFLVQNHGVYFELEKSPLIPLFQRGEISKGSEVDRKFASLPFGLPFIALKKRGNSFLPFVKGG